LRGRILIASLLIFFIVGINQTIILLGFREPRTQLQSELKLLKITGPAFSEVNETISFTITSEGRPVKGATVFFAGYEKETNGSGIATFQIDFVGPFNAIVQKEGYESNSTLLWVFPKGNERFFIRSTKSVSDPQRCGNTISAFKMAGFNYARVKAYYTYDEQGGFYPVIITQGRMEKLSDEAAKAIEDNYQGEVPRYHQWIRVPEDVHLSSLAWMISKVRDWGFKVFLYAQLFFVDPNTGEMKDAHCISLQNEAEETFLKQRRIEALTLTRFAEEQGIELLDPFGEFIGGLPIEEFSLYRNLLPELRKIYSGELVVADPPSDDCDLGGFDYVVVLPGWAPRPMNPDLIEWKDAIHKYLDYTDSLTSKYSVKILPIYIGHIDWIMNSYTSQEQFEKFMNNFNSTEDARIWFINLLFDEILERNIAGADVHPLWFISMLYTINDGEIFQNFSYWPTRKPLNIVSKYFTHPWNKEGKSTLNMLQHAKLAVNSIVTKSSDSDLVNCMSELLEKASRAYEMGECQYAIEILQEILSFFSHIENSLNITIDGNKDDWGHVGPVYYNPSRAFPWFNLIFCYGDSISMDEEDVFILKNTKNLKSVYAINDHENLYLMLEFYNSSPIQGLMQVIGPFIQIDVSGNWSHQEDKEFHLILNRNRTHLKRCEYKGLETFEYALGENGECFLECVYGKVIEVKIPLKLLQNPEKLNLAVWWPMMAPWGDVEVDIMDWIIRSPESSLSISLTSPMVSLGEKVTISGFVYPAHTNATVTLTFEIPDGSLLTRNVNSTILGEFKDTFIPELVGSWTVKASWSGDIDHEGSDSSEVSFIVEEDKVPAKFIVTDLIVGPTEAKVKQPITISIKVTNVGVQNGSYTIDLKINNVTLDTMTVMLAGGESITVIFESVEEEAGMYDVEVAGLKSTFSVKETIIPSSPWELYPTLAAVAITIIGLVIARWFVPKFIPNILQRTK